MMTVYFYGSFTKEDFFSCFFWVKDDLDYDNSSSGGQRYVKNIWAALCTHIKIHIDARQSGNRDAEEGRWRDVLQFWDDLTDNEGFNGVHRAMFAEKLYEHRPNRGRDPARPRKKIFHGHGS
ncbi:uncharacterized protein N7515_009007 [Penicillium bovifimosum]|uniref:Uncharacterized protein n=1 Tax=Penicillium bovifimosum TaxID=126998 RepID=A0A9W9GIX3_9EURO|nr:uncharacterized protein N7515_009007 [Penicillium bovifimosum]KAJ5121046.1 hypothetical protein N7515_009007 [Penicillium bovifimosum]